MLKAHDGINYAFSERLPFVTKRSRGARRLANGGFLLLPGKGILGEIVSHATGLFASRQPL
jgi:hypothetical protein